MEVIDCYSLKLHVLTQLFPVEIARRILKQLYRMLIPPVVQVGLESHQWLEWFPHEFHVSMGFWRIYALPEEHT